MIEWPPNKTGISGAKIWWELLADGSDKRAAELKTLGYEIVVIEGMVGVNVTRFLVQHVRDGTDMIGFKEWQEASHRRPNVIVSLSIYHFIALKDPTLVEELKQLATIDAIIEE